MRRFLPQSLLGQMLLSVAAALLVAQGISAYLQFREAERRREFGSLSGLAFQLVAEPRFEGEPRWRRLRVERTSANPLQPGEVRETQREAALKTILAEQGVEPTQLVVVTRPTSEDAYVMGRLQQRPDLSGRTEWRNGSMIVAALKRNGSSEWTVARVPIGSGAPQQLGMLIVQTLLLYIILVGGLAFVLRRITRPLAALTKRVEAFARSPTTEGQVEPSGPDDARRLITAHNAMEDRIAGLLNEKDVMLGAIGHDLKTPLAALRVRIENVEDDAERAKLAGGIEDIANSLDDILSLARVGRPSDPLERTDLGALVASVVEEYEDLGEPVTLGDTPKIALELRATWLRRAMRNLIGNAVRYGEKAHVSLAQEGREAVIRIEDEGPGIPEDQIGAMLEPFQRGETSRNRETGGAGLGLTLARAIADQHGGRLVLRNGPEAAGRRQGLIAELRLPLD